MINIPKSNRHFNTSAGSENSKIFLCRRIKECKRKHSGNSDGESEADESEGEVP